MFRRTYPEMVAPRAGARIETGGWRSLRAPPLPRDEESESVRGRGRLGVLLSAPRRPAPPAGGGGRGPPPPPPGGGGAGAPPPPPRPPGGGGGPPPPRPRGPEPPTRRR